MPHRYDALTWSSDKGVMSPNGQYPTTPPVAFGAAGLLAKPIDFGLLRGEIDERLGFIIRNHRWPH